MLLVVILFGLVTVGFVVPCLIDVAVTPADDLRSLTKPAWLLIVAFLSAFGAAAWLAVGRPDRLGRTVLPRYLAGTPPIGQAEALRRHPAGRSMETGIDPVLDQALRAGQIPPRPTGPDDDDEFLEELARRIRYSGEADGEA
jgi:hypothetical protein